MANQLDDAPLTPHQGHRDRFLQSGTGHILGPDVFLCMAGRFAGLLAAPGETGRIVVRNPDVYPGHRRMSRRTAEQKRPDGFFLTPDLGQADAGGLVRIEGRGSHPTFSAGHTTQPTQIELRPDAQP